MRTYKTPDKPYRFSVIARYTDRIRPSRRGWPMPLGKQDIYQLLDAHGIAYEAVEHPAVYTVDEADALRLPHPEAGTKNLFLRDDKHRAYYLLTCREDVRVDLKALQHQIGSRRLSFASADDLRDMLGLIPGSVTPLGLLNDEARRVRFLLDEAFAGRLISATQTRTQPRSSCRQTTCSPSSRSTAHP